MKKKYIVIAAFLLLHLCPATSFVQAKELIFIENKSQWHPAVKYKADLPGGAVFLTDAGFTYSFYDLADAAKTDDRRYNKAGANDTGDRIVRWHAYRINFSGAHKSQISYAPQDKRKEYYNFFLGKDSANWAGRVAAFNAIEQRNIYDGIDLKVYSKGAAMKYDFIVAPGADPSQIVLHFEGVRPELMENGSLRIKTSVNEVTEGAPVSYQWIGGRQKEVKSVYRQLKNGDITFEFPEGYDKANTLVIDPSLVFATYSGSTAYSATYSSAYDLNGALFVSGPVLDVGFPVTVGAFQQNFASTAGPVNPATNQPTGTSDLGIQKISPDGSSLIYCTYFGGSKGEGSIDMNITSANELVLLGMTTSADLPTTAGCYDNTLAASTFSNSDYFVVHFNEDGSALTGSTYLGGTGDEAFDWSTSEIGVDNNNNIVIVGNTESVDYPVTANAAQPLNAVPPTIPSYKDGIISRLSPDCSQLLYSTYLGGSTLDACLGLTFNDLGDIIVCGQTNSSDFPTTPNALHPDYQGGDMNGFLTVIDGVTGAIKASTYIAGEGYMTNDARPRRVLYDMALKVQMDEEQNIVVTGSTWGGYPISPGVFNEPNGDCFLDRISPDLSASVQSTRIGINTMPFGGGTVFSPKAFRYSVCGNNYTYIAGNQIYPGMALTADAYSTSPGPGPDTYTGYYLCVLDQDWQNLVYGSYFPINISFFFSDGNSRFDDNGTLYQYVTAPDQSFPTTPGVFAPAYSQTQYQNGTEMASFKFEFPFPSSNVPAITFNDTVLCSQEPFTYDARASNTIPQTTYEWSPPAAVTPPIGSGTVTIDPALSTDIVLLVKNGVCGSATDTLHIKFSDVLNAAIHPADTSICPGDTIMLIASGGNTYTWDPADNMVTDNNTATVWPDGNSTYAVTVSDTNNCQNKINASVHVLALPHVDAGRDIYFATGAAVYLDGSATGNFVWKHDVPDPYTLRPEVKPTQTTTYYLFATSAEGCVAMDSVTAYWVGTGVPNAFSPNGDGLNDVFLPVISNMKGYVLLDFSIYNRWGEKIFYSLDPESGWNGTHNSKPADVGTYFYFIRYRIGDKEFDRKGDVALIR